MKKRFVLFCLICLAACQKKSIAPLSAPAPQKGELELLWRRFLMPDSSSTNSISPVMGENEVAFSASGRRNGEQAPILFLRKEDGELEKTWSQWLARASLFSWENQQSKGHRLFLSDRDFVEVIDLNSGERIWGTNFSQQQGSGLIYVLGDYVYRDTREGGSSQNPGGSIWRSPLDSENWQRVYQYRADDGYTVSFSSMTSASLDNGDELLLFKNRQWNFQSNRGRLDVFCYNLTADTLLWRHKGLEGWDGGVIPLKVQDSSVFCLGDEKAFALDLQTGAKRWEFDYRARSSGDHFGLGDLFINGDRLIIKPSGEQLFALDKHTGDLLWWRNDMGWSMDGRFSHFENKLFYVADAELFIVDDYSGETILNSSGKGSFGFLKGDVRIDGARRVMYVASYREAFCLKIPDI